MFDYINFPALHSLTFIWENTPVYFWNWERKLSHNRHLTTRVCWVTTQSPLEAMSVQVFPELNCHNSNGHFGDAADILACRYTVPYLSVWSCDVSADLVASACVFRLTPIYEYAKTEACVFIHLPLTISLHTVFFCAFRAKNTNKSYK